MLKVSVMLSCPCLAIQDRHAVSSYSNNKMMKCDSYRGTLYHAYELVWLLKQTEDVWTFFLQPMDPFILWTIIYFPLWRLHVILATQHSTAQNFCNKTERQYIQYCGCLTELRFNSCGESTPLKSGLSIMIVVISHRYSLRNIYLLQVHPEGRTVVGHTCLV